MTRLISAADMEVSIPALCLTVAWLTAYSTADTVIRYTMTPNTAAHTTQSCSTLTKNSLDTH